MDSESEIQYCASSRQFYDISLRGIEEYASFKDLDAQILLELLLIIYRRIRIDYLLKFLDPVPLLLRNLNRSIMFHIGEMGGYAEFCDIFHIMSPDLDLDRETEHAQDSGMDALIPIEFGYRDIIFDLLDQWGIIFMDYS